MGGPVNTGYRVVFPSPTPKDCHFPTIHIYTPIFVFTFHWRSWSWGLNILCENAQLNTCRWTDWSIIRGIIWISADLHHLNEGVPWHLWAKINPDNVQQDFRGWTNEGNRSNYKGVKNDSCQMFLWTPTAETSQPKRSLLQKNKSNKICFMTIHKSLMFAISHAAFQTSQAMVKMFKMHAIPYKHRKHSLLDVVENMHSNNLD